MFLKRFLVPLSLSILLSACSGAAPGAPSSSDPDQAGNVPSMIYANGWTDISMIANYAKTGVDQLGHFSTSRNACGKDDYGALSLALWNQLAAALNTAVAADPLPQADEYCVPLPENRPPRYMDGNIEIHLTNGTKRVLMDATRGTGGCTTIRDREAAAKLFDALNQVVMIADKEGCSVLPY